MISSLVSMQLDQAFLADIANKWICQISYFMDKILKFRRFWPWIANEIEVF